MQRLKINTWQRRLSRAGPDVAILSQVALELGSLEIANSKTYVASGTKD